MAYPYSLAQFALGGVDHIQMVLYECAASKFRSDLVKWDAVATCRGLMLDSSGKLWSIGAHSKGRWCESCCTAHQSWEKERCMPIARRPKSTGNSGSESPPAMTGKVLTGFANVLEFLSMRIWPDGSRRETGTLTLSVEGDVWKATLKDRDSAGVAFVTARTPDDLLKAMDKGLEAGSLEWRDDKFQGGSGKRRG